MPSDPKVSDTRIYELGSSSEVRITITIGDAQVGAPQGLYQGRPVAMTPGEPAALAVQKNTVLHTVTTVQDVNPNTNRTDVTYDLEGGAQPATYTYGATVSDDGHVLYLVDFLFV